MSKANSEKQISLASVFFNLLFMLLLVFGEWLLFTAIDNKAILVILCLISLFYLLVFIYRWYADFPVNEPSTNDKALQVGLGKRPKTLNRSTHLGIYMVCTYLIIVLMFSAIYFASTKISGSIIDTSYISIVTGGRTDKVINHPCDYIYFSAVSGSTLGYGDLLPIGLPRYVVCIEVIMFWFLVIIASIKLSWSTFASERND